MSIIHPEHHGIPGDHSGAWYRRLASPCGPNNARWTASLSPRCPGLDAQGTRWGCQFASEGTDAGIPVAAPNHPALALLPVGGENQLSVKLSVTALTELRIVVPE
jgi:hypothetical protein